MPCLACIFSLALASQIFLVSGDTVVRKHIDVGAPVSLLSIGERDMPAVSEKIQSVLEEFQEMARTGAAPDKEKIRTIKTIVVDELLPDVIATHTSAKTQVGINLAAIATCNVNSKKRLASIENMTENAVVRERKDHADCRVEHKKKISTKTDACKQLDEFLEGVTTPASIPEPRARGAMVTYVTTMSDYFCREGPICENLDKACDEATASHDTHKSACDLKQRIFESGFCTWKTELIDDCKDLDTCYGDAKKAYTTHVNTTQELVRKWKVEYAALKKIECYINVWLSDDNTETVNKAQLDACDSKPVDTTPMDVDFGSPEAKQQCPQSKDAWQAVNVYPGQQAWADREYSAFKDLVVDVVACD